MKTKLRAVLNIPRRNYWVMTKLSETEGVNEIGKFNTYRFVPLPFYACSLDGVRSAMEGCHGIPPARVLFYHKETQYTFGVTPLVLSLEATKLPQLVEVLSGPQNMASASTSE
jgi:hypothetical protein